MTTVLITGTTRGLGRVTTFALAQNPKTRDLLLVGRGGTALERVAEQARARGVNVYEIGCDLSRLSEVDRRRSPCGISSRVSTYVH